MAKTWIVVAHRAGARIFEHIGPRKGLALIDDLDHPQGRMRNRDFDADRGGSTYSIGGPGVDEKSREQSAHERDAANWARQLADIVNHARTDNRLLRLVLVAEPHFLGLLRESLDDNTADLVIGTVRKDLAYASQDEIAAQLEGTIRV